MLETLHNPPHVNHDRFTVREVVRHPHLLLFPPRLHSTVAWASVGLFLIRIYCTALDSFVEQQVIKLLGATSLWERLYTSGSVVYPSEA